MQRILRLGRAALMLAAPALLYTGCMTARGGSVAEKRTYVKQMRDEALTELYGRDASLRSKIASAAGYAAFSNLAGGVLFVSTGQGYGVAHNNRSGRDTYMKMAELGAGMGLGLRHFRAIYVFNDAETFRKFVDQGWEFGADANAALIAGGTGVAGGAEGNVVAGGAASGGSGSAGGGNARAAGAGSAGSSIEIYQLTESGLMLRGGVAGTKYWKDSDLN